MHPPITPAHIHALLESPLTEPVMIWWTDPNRIEILPLATVGDRKEPGVVVALVAELFIAYGPPTPGDTWYTTVTEGLRTTYARTVPATGTDPR